MTANSPRKLFCFGMGYTANALARRLHDTTQIVGTSRHTEPGVSRIDFDGTKKSLDVTRSLQGATHVLVSIPPTLTGDPALTHHGDDLAALQTLRWIGYLSTIGVYGDADGAWVDESSPVKPQTERGQRRAAAEAAWRRFGTTHRKRVQIFRLPGIYGPGRSALDTVRNGTARRIVKSGQVFNRIHVDDIASALDLAMDYADDDLQCPYDTFNVVDDEPAPPQDVIAYAARLLGQPAPPEVSIDAANLSAMALSFYGESKRVRNDRIKVVFGWHPDYPSYREGLGDIAAQG